MKHASKYVFRGYVILIVGDFNTNYLDELDAE